MLGEQNLFLMAINARAHPHVYIRMGPPQVDEAYSVVLGMCE